MKKVLISVICFLAFLPGVTFASSFTSIHNPILDEVPAWFKADGQGGFYGETETGLAFTQHAIVTNNSVRLHKFSIASDFFYITDRGVIEAGDDLEALSIYFSLS